MPGKLLFLIFLSHPDVLQCSTIILSLLVLLLGIVTVILYRLKMLNRELQQSRDVLDMKNKKLEKAEEELLQAKEAAEASSRMKTVFIQNMSHQIRTPLNSIVGFSAVLSEIFSDGKEEVKQCSAAINENSQLLLKIISDIIDISDLDENSNPIERAPTYINDCCLRAIEEVRPQLIAGVILQYKPCSETMVINSNDTLLMHVLRNVLSNAAKFTFTGTIVLAFALSPDEKHLLFTITDTGIGIPENKHDYVFQRFTKLNDFGLGTGLGLPIAQLSALKLGGQVVIDKNYKEGTRFIIEIPVI